MTAATKDRDTQRMPGQLRGPFPLAAAVKCFAGTIACLDTSNNMTKGATSTGLTAIGVFDATYDNSAGAAGAIQGQVLRGIFGPFANSSAADLIENKNIGGTCYIVDDQTVAKTDGSSTRSKCGVIHYVDANGVWVNFN